MYLLEPETADQSERDMKHHATNASGSVETEQTLSVPPLATIAAKTIFHV
jgi:hypothetical protein